MAFDGTYLAARLMRRYQAEFMNMNTGGGNMSANEVKLLLAWYAEDVMRTVEKEVRYGWVLNYIPLPS